MGTGTNGTSSVNLLDALLDALADRIVARLGEAAPTNDLLTPAEAAALLKVDRRWVYKHADELGAVHLTRRKLRIPRAGIDRRLKRGKR